MEQVWTECNLIGTNGKPYVCAWCFHHKISQLETGKFVEVTWASREAYPGDVCATCGKHYTPAGWKRRSAVEGTG